MIFGQVETSKLSIDSFKALDTTRIFVFYTDETFWQEDKYINDISDKFSCNRTGGGIPEFGAVSILGNARHRNLQNK